MLYEINEKVIKLENEGKKIIKFNLGDPDQRTDEEIVEAGINSMKTGMIRYGSAFGSKNLRERLAQVHNTNPKNILIAPGSKWAIFSSMFTLLKSGENVIVPSPHWTSYELIAKEIGAEIRFLKTRMENDWRIDVEKMEDLIDEKTRLIIFSNPNNPTSKIIDSKTLEKTVELADSKNIKIISDESYSDISFEKIKSILEFSSNHIFVNSFSKTFAMTGWRIGYLIAEEKFVEKLAKLNQITITNVPLFVQDAAVKAVELKDKIANQIREIYRKRADFTNKILSKTNLKFSKPDAPFYFFVKCNSDSEKLAFELLDRGVAIVPGTAFGDYREYFRIALTLPDNEIKTGLEKLVESFQQRK